jgi:uncharacterized protein
LERDDAYRDKELIEYLKGLFTDKGFAVSIYYPPNAAFKRIIDPNFKLRKIPGMPWRFLMALSLIFRPIYWKYFIDSHIKRVGTIQFQAESFMNAFQTLSPLPTFILGRSTGARITSLVADQLAVAGIICIGYPFKNPDGGDEPARYKHLEFLKTPCLLLQGEKDPYGGSGLDKKYKLSETIILKFMDVDHDFILTEEARVQFSKLVDQFIIENLPVASNGAVVS